MFARQKYLSLGKTISFNESFMLIKYLDLDITAVSLFAFTELYSTLTSYLLKASWMQFEDCYTFCAFGGVFAEHIVGGIGRFRILIYVEMLFSFLCRHWRLEDSMSYKKHCKLS